MSFVNALKAYSLEQGTTFKIPKKGTAEYEAVKAIQERIKLEPPAPSDGSKPAKKVRAAKIANPVPVAEVAPVTPVTVKAARKNGPKVANSDVQPEPAVVEEKKKVVRTRKAVVKVANVEPVVEVVEVVTPAKKQPKVKLQKIANIIQEPVIIEAAPEVKIKISLTKEERLLAKEAKAATKNTSKKTPVDARMIILEKPISFRFD